MKKAIVKSIIFMMVAFVSQAVNAQNIVTNISTNDFQSCKAYLAEHPLDTIKNGAVKVFVAGGKIVRTIVRTGSTVAPAAHSTTKVVRQEAKKVERHGNVTDVTYADGTSKTFTKTTSDKVSHEDMVAVENGEKMAYKPGHRNIAGEFRHKVYLTPMVGGMYVVDDHEFQPLLTLKGGYETCHFIFELDFSGSWMKYTDTAEAAGHYSSLAAYVGAGWKVWNSELGYSYIAIGGSGGYAYQRTDEPNADVFSDNYGFAAKGWLRGNFALNRTLSLVGEIGYNLLPKVYHEEEQDYQDLGHGGVYAQFGLNIRFR